MDVQTWAILVALFGLGFTGFFFGNRRIDDLRSDMNARFVTVDARFASVEARLARVEDRLTGVETRLTGVETRLTGVADQITRLHEEFRDFRTIVQEALRARTT